MATLKNTTINDTGFITLPTGTTAQRPAIPVAGMTRFNTTLGEVEVYNGTGWYSRSNPNNNNITFPSISISILLILYSLSIISLSEISYILLMPQKEIIDEINVIVFKALYP